MQARITKSFRIAEGENTRKYTAGEVATDAETAKWAVQNGYGEELAEKAQTAAKNKSRGAAPENKGEGGAA